RGAAGAGKTTILHWLAVNATDDVAFFVPLRNYVERPLPTEPEFVRHEGQRIAEQMRPDWVAARLAAGRAWLLVDGVDEVGEAALEMLLERRDLDRDIPDTVLSRREKMTLLQDVAFWMMRNGLSGSDSERVVRHLHRKLPTLHRVDVAAEPLLRYLIARSGVL